MATLSALPYSHEHYDTLPDIIDAASFLSSSSSEINMLTSSIGSIFIKYGVQNVFGLIFLHRHFDMDPTEILVEFGNVSVPWDTGCNKKLDQIMPTSWRFTSGGLVPYEFTSNKVVLATETRTYDSFVQELRAFLEENHLDQMFGLSRIPESGFQSAATIEFTSGRANVTVPDLLWAQDDKYSAIEASWQFGTEGADLPGAIVVKRCKNKCEPKNNTGEHAKRHITTKKNN